MTKKELDLILSGTNLRGVNLSGAKLNYPDLISGAKLNYPDLISGAKLNYPDLISGAKLEGAIGIHVLYC